MNRDEIAGTAVADSVIIGAGLCGLMAAGRLLDSGAGVTLLDKGRSVGGRMATRRIGAGLADHGAQFFSVRADRFAAYAAAWRTQNLIFVWSNGWSDGSVDAVPGSEGHPRYAVRGGMNALPKQLAADLAARGAHIETGVRVTRVMHDHTGWLAEADDGRAWRGRSLVLTPPVPQSLALLDAGGVTLAETERAALDAVAYAPCLCAICRIDGSAWLPAPGAVQRPQSDIAWIADNQRKGISPHAAVLTLHGSPAWSAAHYNDADDMLRERFLAALREWSGGDEKLRELQIKRWRYALPTHLFPATHLRAAGLPPLYFGGDGFGSPRVEGAILSGLTLGDLLSAELG